MKCPHCLVEMYPNTAQMQVGTDINGGWTMHMSQCPNCSKNSYTLNCHNMHGNLKYSALVYPKAINRNPVPNEVPFNLTTYYNQACLVLQDSPMASAAISRRCLQHILRDTLKVKHSDLTNEIQEVIDKSLLPSDLLESIDAIRNIGNFASHPFKSKSTGEIVEVEAGEAEWNLDVLEMLFEYLYVRPEVVKKKREALNKKLQDAGKPAMKG